MHLKLTSATFKSTDARVDNGVDRPVWTCANAPYMSSS